VVGSGPAPLDECPVTAQTPPDSAGTVPLLERPQVLRIRRRERRVVEVGVGYDPLEPVVVEYLRELVFGRDRGVDHDIGVVEEVREFAGQALVIQ